jgi:hypothetical protein
MTYKLNFVYTWKVLEHYYNFEWSNLNNLTVYCILSTPVNLP